MCAHHILCEDIVMILWGRTCWSTSAACVNFVSLKDLGLYTTCCSRLLQKSKSVAKRQREEAEESKIDRAAKKIRLEMRQRGHVVRHCITIMNHMPSRVIRLQPWLDCHKVVPHT